MSLQDAVRLISSDRTKDRSDGLEQYRDLLQDDRALQDLSEGDDEYSEWLIILQALFSSVVNERLACLKKGLDNAAPIALRRLKDAASTVQWTVERAYALFPSAAFNATFRHLTQLLNDRGALLEPIAVDYLKALRILLGHKPHLDHLDEVSWVNVTSICFNILLGDDMRRELNEPSPVVRVSDSEGDESPAPRASRMLDAEVASCLQILLSSPQAPICGAKKYGTHVLERYASFLQAFSSDTTAHLPALQGLNSLLAELDVNEVAALRRFALRSWEQLLKLWTTKIRPLKEQLIVTFNTLLPHLVDASEAQEHLGMLLDKLLEEPEQRFALQPLSLSSFELCTSRREAAFQYRSLRASNSILHLEAQTWITIEMAADCALSLQRQESPHQFLTEMSHEPPLKRQKGRKAGSTTPHRDGVLQQIIQSATQVSRKHDGETKRLWLLQVILFVCLRQDRTSPGESPWAEKSFDNFADALGHEDAELQNWILLILANMPCKDQSRSQVWPSVCRRILQNGTSRVAAHAASMMMMAITLKENEIMSETEIVLGGLEMQGPPILSDSISSFLVAVLKFTSKDISATRSKPKEKISTWLQGIWADPDTRSRNNIYAYPLNRTLLLATLCDLTVFPTFQSAELYLPATMCASRLRSADEAKVIRTFLLTAKLPPSDDGSRDDYAGMSLSSHLSARSPKALEVRCLNMILKSLRLEIGRLREPAFAIAATKETVRECCSLALTAMLFNWTLQVNDVATQFLLVELAQEILTLSLHILCQDRWSMADIASVLTLISPFLRTTQNSVDTVHNSVLNESGSNSGIPIDVLLHPQSREDYAMEEVDVGTMKMLWGTAKQVLSLVPFRKMYERATFLSWRATEKATVAAEDDEWDQSSSVASRRMRDRAEISSHSSDCSLVSNICLTALISLPCWAKVDEDGHAQVKEYFLNEDTAVPALLGSGHSFLQAVRQNRITLEVAQLVTLLETIGDDILAEYSYSGNTDAQLIAIEFLDASLSHWAFPSERAEADDLLKDALKLCSFFVGQLSRRSLHWKVEARLSFFLEKFLNVSLQKASAISAQKRKTLSPDNLLKHLLALNDRPDIRLRWIASRMTARVLELAVRADLELHPLYLHLESLLPKDTDSLEMMSTRIFSFANILVASAPLRHLALYHILELSLVDDSFDRYSGSILREATRLLCFHHTYDLWLLFAPQVTWAIATNGYQVDRLPFLVLGYGSAKHMMEHCFRPVASMLMAMDTPPATASFQTFAKMAGKTEREGYLECIPFFVATELSTVVSSQDDGRAFDDLLQHSGRRLQMGRDDVRQALLAQVDTLVISLLRLFYELDGQAFFTHIRKLGDNLCATTLEQMEAFVHAASHEPPKPHDDAKAVYRSIHILAKHLPDTLAPATIYSVMHQMTSQILSERLVNEQRRHLQALKLYLSVAQSSVKGNASLLRLLVHSSSVLLGQADLVETVWPLLEWTLRHVSMEIPDLSTSFLLLLRHAQRLSRSRYVQIRQTGDGLSLKFGACIQRLRAIGSTKIVALDTICAWPDEWPATLAKPKLGISLSKLTEALLRTSTVSASFLQRFAHGLQNSDDDQIANFGSKTIWVLLQYLGRERRDTQEQTQLSASFGNILYHCAGRIRFLPSSTELEEQSLHGKSSALFAIKRLDGNESDSLKAWLAFQLIQLSRSVYREKASAAITCLRIIFTDDPHFAGASLANWTKIDAAELRMITSIPAVTIATSKIRNRKELEGKTGADLAKKCCSWIIWICQLLCELLGEKDDYAPLGHISLLFQDENEQTAEFARDVFAVLLHLFLRSDIGLPRAQRQDSLAVSAHIIDILRQPYTDKEVWKIIIAAILQLRHDKPGHDPLDCDRWIHNIDFYLLQQRAVQCRLYASAILFAELEKEHKGDKVVKSGGSSIDAEDRLALQYETYSNIDDPDSFYGIRNPDVTNSLMSRLQHEQQWHRLFDFYAAQHEDGDTSLANLATSLHHQGFHRLSLQLDEKQDSAYSAAWRMGKWDLPVQDLQAGSSQTLYAALRAVHREVDQHRVQKAIDRAYYTEYAGLAGASPEAIKAVRCTASDIIGLRELQQRLSSADTAAQDRIIGSFDFDDVERLLSVRLSVLQAARSRLQAEQLGDALTAETANIARIECRTLIQLSEESRREGKLQSAVTAITQAQRVANDLGEQAADEEFANLLWDLGEHATAIDALSRMVKIRLEVCLAQNVDKDERLPLALARLGQWRATARSHQPQAIRDECFDLAAQRLASSILSDKEKAFVLYQYAVFAHEQYRLMMKSNEGVDLAEAIRYRKEEIEQHNGQLRGAIGRTPHASKVARAREKAETLVRMDEEKLTEFERSKMRFRKEATYFYALAASTTDKFDDRAVVRIISLWFENAEDEKLNKELNGWLKEVPSHKFLPFVQQLCSRLSSSSSSSNALSMPIQSSSPDTLFQTSIRDTVYRMSLEHPFHTLTALYALSRADDDRDRRQTMRKGRDGVVPSLPARSSQTDVPLAIQSRKEAAAAMIDLIATTHAKPQRIKDWKLVCDACVEWARFDLVVQMPTIFGPDGARSSRTNTHTIAASFRLAITKLRDVEVPVLTRHLPVDRTCKYDDVVFIRHYRDQFTTAGGVHLPKISDCIGSDGKAYRQLFKNRDDLRQDAVMQQVFSVLNGLLQVDRAARKRQLRVRKYIVIPLGPQYGLLEFVGNSQPLQTPLLATHHTYRRKGHITPSEARARISSFESKGKTRAERKKNFQMVCDLLPPTFRFHFLEQRKTPITLLTTRLHYTRSVATTSIVGHVLGLGDRHVSNILLDNLTGELIHIDFGVAFDQGRLLPIPELVPFRLTRDMVDAMGLHGVEGVFRRCCQETLRVLREGASVIETVLQVFKFDPLYDWTQNPVKVIRAQAHASQEASSSVFDSAQQQRRLSRPSHQRRGMAGISSHGGGGEGGAEGKKVAELQAERAIATVMEKLSASLSVEYTVNDLMMQAMDSGNLGSIFSGWQAAL